MKATWLGSLRLSPESPVRLTLLTPKSSISLRGLCGSWVKSEASSTPTCGYLCSRVPCLDRPRYRTGTYHVRPLGWAARGRRRGWTPWLYSSQCWGPLTAHALTHVWWGASTAEWRWWDFQREKQNRGAKEERRNNAEKPDPGQRKENSHGPRWITTAKQNSQSHPNLGNTVMRKDFGESLYFLLGEYFCTEKPIWWSETSKSTGKTAVKSDMIQWSGKTAALLQAWVIAEILISAVMGQRLDLCGLKTKW